MVGASTTIFAARRVGPAGDLGARPCEHLENDIIPDDVRRRRFSMRPAGARIRAVPYRIATRASFSQPKIDIRSPRSTGGSRRGHLGCEH